MKIHEIIVAPNALDRTDTANSSSCASDAFLVSSQNISPETRSYTKRDIGAQKLKIELALEGLNLDEDEIKDLKKGFDLGTTSDDVSAALLELQGKRLDTGYRRKRKQAPTTCTFNPYYPVESSRQYHYPPTFGFRDYGSVHQLPCRPVKSIRETCPIHTKVRDYKDRWEILVFAPEFEVDKLQIFLIAKPGRNHAAKQAPFPNAVLIKGHQVLYMKTHGGLSIQRVLIGQSVAELGNTYPPGEVTMIPLTSGHMTVKILKQ
jgi:hypothetical protein